jgi:hypothetical protein
MTSAIGSVSDLVRVIQAQLTQRPGVPAARGRARARTDVAGAASDELAALIELRVRQLDRDDPQRGRKAFRLFLESVLLAQFGSGAGNDPKFHLLVDDVQAAMERSDGMRAMMDQAIGHLLAKA